MMKIEKEVKVTKVSFEKIEECEAAIGIIRYFAHYAEKEIIPVTSETQKLLTFARAVVGS